MIPIYSTIVQYDDSYQLQISCFCELNRDLLINALRNIKTKMLKFSTKIAVKVTKGQIYTGTICIKNLMLLVVLFMWNVSYLY